MFSRFFFLILFIPLISSANIAEDVLLVRDPLFTDSSKATNDGFFSFGQTVRRLIPNNTEKATEDWFRTWHHPQLINGFLIPARAPQILLDVWPRQWMNVNLDLNQSPFRLLAIVTRLDLRSKAEPGGEVRLIYGAYDIFSGRPLDLTIIFEYGLQNPSDNAANDEIAASRWAGRLNKISHLPRLEDKIEAWENIFSQINGQLRRVRTNDFLFDFVWEFRQFRVQDGAFVLELLNDTPDLVFNAERKSELVNVLGSGKPIPKELLTGSSLLVSDHFFWLENENLPPGVKQEFAMKTCNGCHGAESRTIFTHIATRELGQRAHISNFLKDELVNREYDFENLLEQKNLMRLPKRAHRVH
jgi:hypothetical protein